MPPESEPTSLSSAVCEPETENAKAHAPAGVLIVDDEALNIRWLEQVLKSHGYHDLHSTTDPHEAVDLYHRYGPDVILLDINMPRMNGFEVMEGLHQQAGKKFLPIIVATANTDKETRRRAFATHGRDFISKPFDETEVISRVENMVALSRLHKTLESRATALEHLVSARTARLRKALGALQTAHDKLLEKNSKSLTDHRRKAEHMAMLAHEFRTPLNCILGFSELLKEQKFGPLGGTKYIEYAEEIHYSATHLQGLIDNILDISKADSGKDTIVLSAVDMKKTIGRVTAMMEDQAQRAGIRLHTDIEENFPLVKTDPQKI